MFKTYMLILRDFNKNLGEDALFKTISDHHSSSCVYINFQCGIQSTLNSMIVGLFNEIIKVSCFSTLRTQVSKIVFIYIKSLNSI